MLTILKVQASSVIATAVDFVCSGVFYHVCGLSAAFSTPLGNVAGGVVNCLCNYHWSFAGNGARLRRVFMRYSLVWFVSMLINMAGTTWLNDYMPYLLAKCVVAIAVGLGWNYTMYKYFVYKRRK